MDAVSLIAGFAAGALIATAALLLAFRALRRQAEEAQARRLGDREEEIGRLRAAEERLEGERTHLAAEVEALRATLALEREASREKLQLLDEAKRQLQAQFEQAASRIIEEKSARLTGQSVERLQEILSPLREQLGDFRKKVEDVYDKEGRERTTLLAEIKQLKELNNRISREATDLTHALKGESKMRGNWGELILERVLEQSGLVNGREYETQVHLVERHGGNRARYPDVVVRLPEGRDVVIDAKVTLNAYERYVNAPDAAARADALREHLAAVRQHIRGLSARQYQDLEGIRPMDLVLMCVPNESAFITAVSEDAALHDEAMREQVVLVGPTTLLLTLRIIASMWRTEYQNRNALDIAERGRLLLDKFAGFVEDLDAIGGALDNASEKYQSARARLSTGRGNLVEQAGKLVELGVKARKKLTEEAS
jgi:DNA recombination protein RmuC